MFLKVDDLIKNETIPGVIALIIISIYNSLVFFSTREELINYTREDGIVEYASVACYLASALVFFFLSLKAKINIRTDSSGHIRHIFYFILALVMIGFAGEEISWGQRLLEYNIPEYWKHANRQGEANLHNLNLWDALDTSGNKKNGIMRLFSSVALYTYFWFFLFVVMPIVTKIWSAANDYIKMMGIPVFNFFYGLLFMVNFLTLEFIEGIGIELRPVGEVKETNFAVLYLAACISILAKSEHKIHKSLKGQ